MNNNFAKLAWGFFWIYVVIGLIIVIIFPPKDPPPMSWRAPRDDGETHNRILQMSVSMVTQSRLHEVLRLRYPYASDIDMEYDSYSHGYASPYVENVRFKGHLMGRDGIHFIDVEYSSNGVAISDLSLGEYDIAPSRITPLIKADWEEFMEELRDACLEK